MSWAAAKAPRSRRPGPGLGRVWGPGGGGGAREESCSPDELGRQRKARGLLFIPCLHSVVSRTFCRSLPTLAHSRLLPEMPTLLPPRADSPILWPVTPVAFPTRSQGSDGQRVWRPRAVGSTDTILFFKTTCFFSPLKPLPWALFLGGFSRSVVFRVRSLDQRCQHRL